MCSSDLMWSSCIARIVASASLTLFAVGTVAAQADYPNRTVKIVVPNPPGTSLDVIPRIIGEKLAIKWGQSVIIENRPGAAQNLGAEAVASSEPDGYTLLASPPGPLAVSQWFFPKLRFEPATLVPVSVMVTLPTVIVAGPRAPVSTMQDLIAYAKSNPAKVTYGSPGTGSTPQLAVEEMARAAGVQLVHVPYQGMGPAQRDLLGGQIDLMLDIAGNALPLIRDGRLRALAVTSATRIPELPDVPAISEIMPGFVHTEWFAMVAPPKTPPALVTKISQAIAETLRLPDVTQRLRDFVASPVGSSPAEAVALVKRESDRWRQLISVARLKSE